MRLRYIIVCLCILLPVKFSYAQTDSIFHQGGYRTFIVHLPPGYTSSDSYPLVLNFHGLNSNAAQQQSYTGFDLVADTAQFIVVYPQGTNDTWQLSPSASPNDIDFVSLLIDSLKSRYSLDTSCVFATGISMGGFMTYVLACELSDKLAAIAVVSGNMLVTTQAACSPVKGMPVMHIHGTSDFIVSYNGAFGIPTVEETVSWWVSKNQCDSTQKIITPLADINTSDNCTVTKTVYNNSCRDNSEVVFYRIDNGGHTWPGASPVILLGNTNQDFNASGEIWKFFRAQCSSKALSIRQKTEKPADHFEIYPNPFSNLLTVVLRGDMENENYALRILNVLGQEIYTEQNIVTHAIINTQAYPEGIYFLQVQSNNGNLSYKIIKQ